MPKTQRYPAVLKLSYPNRPLNRVSTFFRPFLVVPALILLVLLSGNGKTLGTVVVLPTLLMLVFRHKYPKWWFDWNLAFVNFLARVLAYAFLLTDVYPATDEPQGVKVTLTYPRAARDLNRWLPLVKWLLAIPHYMLLMLLYIAVGLAVLAAWFVIIFTGRLPRDLFDFIESVMRWHVRVAAYAFLMTTDIYPPFSLD